jgi:hypothetical protein
MRRLFFALVFVGVLALGCTSDPTSVAGGTPAFGAAGNSGCYAVNITSHAAGVFPAFSGTTTGDVEATISTAFDAGASVSHGVVIGNEGTTTWSVTGGIIPELVGQVFETETKSNLTILQPDNDPFVFAINGAARARSGVAKANLTFHGSFDLGDFVPPFDVDLVWHGVICP